MSSATMVAVIRRQVAWRLDCQPDGLRTSSPFVKPHGPHFADYHGIYIWLMEGAATISAPPEWVAVVQSAIARQTGETLGYPDFWHAASGARIERIVGPSYQGYVDRATFRPQP